MKHLIKQLITQQKIIQKDYKLLSNKIFEVFIIKHAKMGPGVDF